MKHWAICVVLATAAGSGGCMQTRHVDASSTVCSTPGPCPNVTHDSTYDEQRWCGFWPFQMLRCRRASEICK